MMNKEQNSTNTIGLMVREKILRELLMANVKIEVKKDRMKSKKQQAQLDKVAFHQEVIKELPWKMMMITLDEEKETNQTNNLDGVVMTAWVMRSKNQ